MISIIIPAYNAAATIGEQLAALAAEEVDGPWEVVVADNGSTDDTRATVLAWTTRLPDLRVVDAGQRSGAAHARNVGVRVSRGEHLLMCDADDVIGHGWIGHLAGALRQHSLVCGLIDRAALNPRFASLWRGRAPVAGPMLQHDYLPVAPSGNLGVRRDLFDALHGFDVTLARGQDTDFTWRAIQAGAALHVVPEAILYVRLPAARRDWLRRAGATGGFGPALSASPAARMRRLPPRDALRAYGKLLSLVPAVVGDAPAACSWAYEAGVRGGRLVASARTRTMFL